MTEATDPMREDAALAAEYALQLLDPDERAAFEARLRDDPALQALVREWDEHFARMAAEVGPVDPPHRVKTGIDARLFGTGADASGPVEEARGWLGRVLGFGALAAVLVALAVLFGTDLIRTTTGPTMIAEIAAEDRSMLLRASLTGDGGALRVEHLEGAPPEGRVLELWLIAPNALAPISLGVLRDGKTTVLDIPESLRVALPGGTLAVSDEPPGGSPTGAPTGEVHATGAVTPS